MLTINPIIYAELSAAFSTLESLDSVIERLQLAWLELSRPALFLAGKAFARYRGAGGTKTQVLADFFIGAQAAVESCPALTRDPRRYTAVLSDRPLDHAPELTGRGSPRL